MQQPLPSTLAGIRDVLVPFFRELSIERAIIFGSLARGTAGEKSDLDLLLIKETDQRFFDRYTGVLEGLYRRVRGRDIDVLIYTPAELEAVRHRPFIKSILEEGVCLYESGESDRRSQALAENR